MKRTKRVKNAEIADVETWLTALENGKLSDFNIRDPHLLRAIGIAQRSMEDRSAYADADEWKRLEWNLAYAVSTALDKGETWYGVARTLGMSNAEAKARFSDTVERLKAEREQIAEEQEMDAQQREDDEADTEDQDHDDSEYDPLYNVPFEDLSEEDKEAASRLADAIAAFEPVDTSQVREGGYITVVNDFDACYRDRVLRVAMSRDGQLERVLLAGPPNHWVSFSSDAGWVVTGYEPPQYQEGWVGWATVQTEENVTTRMFGMWCTVKFGSQERLDFVSSDNGRYYTTRDVHGFDRVNLLHPGPLEDFKAQGAQWLYEFGNMAQGVSEDARAPWERISGKKFYLDRMAELIELLKGRL